MIRLFPADRLAQIEQLLILQSNTRFLMAVGCLKVGLPRMAQSLPNTSFTEMPTDSYKERTEQNVIDSDGTLIVSHGKLTGGSAYTGKMAKKHNRPYFHVDLNEIDVLPAASGDPHLD